MWAELANLADHILGCVIERKNRKVERKRKKGKKERGEKRREGRREAGRQQCGCVPGRLLQGRDLRVLPPDEEFL